MFAHFVVNTRSVDYEFCSFVSLRFLLCPVTHVGRSGPCPTPDTGRLENLTTPEVPFFDQRILRLTGVVTHDRLRSWKVSRYRTHD